LDTITFYDKNAAKFAENTFGLDVSELYGPFLESIPTGGRILDAGCGSGRDALHFARLGYDVVAFDASPAMAAEASSRTGLQVLALTFSELKFRENFDGVWACASLLHVTKGDMRDALRSLADALKSGGVMYASFKYGTDQRLDSDSRLFSDYNEETFSRLLSEVPLLVLIRSWITTDVRPGRESERWLNLILRKTSFAAATER
jgi:SAM-dependent methyltransferase